MRKINFSDIMFWILMALIVGTAIWKLFGSPTDTASLIAIALFVATSELLIWKEVINKDKKTCIGFEKIKSEFRFIRGDLNNIKNELNDINNKLDKINTKGRK